MNPPERKDPHHKRPPKPVEPEKPKEAAQPTPPAKPPQTAPPPQRATATPKPAPAREDGNLSPGQQPISRAEQSGGKKNSKRE